MLGLYVAFTIKVKQILRVEPLTRWPRGTRARSRWTAVGRRAAAGRPGCCDWRGPATEHGTFRQAGGPRAHFEGRRATAGGLIGMDGGRQEGSRPAGLLRLEGPSRPRSTGRSDKQAGGPRALFGGRRIRSGTAAATAVSCSRERKPWFLRSPRWCSRVPRGLASSARKVSNSKIRVQRGSNRW